MRGNDIGIIAPYNAQTRLLKTNFQFDQDDVRAQAIRDVLGEDRAEELGDIEIKTVDGFEGREKAVIIVSFVRSNPYGWVGFLADWRRLNVALTRARRVSEVLFGLQVIRYHLSESQSFSIICATKEGMGGGGDRNWEE